MVCNSQPLSIIIELYFVISFCQLYICIGPCIADVMIIRVLVIVTMNVFESIIYISVYLLLLLSSWRNIRYYFLSYGLKG